MSTMSTMDIGPLEYVVIGLQDHHFRQDILPELKSIQQSGLIRIIDLLFVRKAADGTVTMQEVSELRKEEREAYGDLEDALGGWFTVQDVEILAKEIPIETLAVVVLLEHSWTLGLADAVRKAGGVLVTGGMISPEGLTQMSVELTQRAAQEETYA